MNIQQRFLEYCRQYLNDPQLWIIWVENNNGSIRPKIRTIVDPGESEQKHLQLYYNILVRHQN